MKPSEAEQFNRSFHWIINVFKSQDLSVIRAFQRGSRNILDSPSFTNILVAAMNYLAQNDKKAFYYAIHHLDVNFCVEMRRNIAVESAYKLAQLGFIPGQDFSYAPMGYLIINQNVANIISNSICFYNSLLLQEVMFLAS